MRPPQEAFSRPSGSRIREKATGGRQEELKRSPRSSQEARKRPPGGPKGTQNVAKRPFREPKRGQREVQRSARSEYNKKNVILTTLSKEIVVFEWSELSKMTQILNQNW